MDYPNSLPYNPNPDPNPDHIYMTVKSALLFILFVIQFIAD